MKKFYTMQRNPSTGEHYAAPVEGIVDEGRNLYMYRHDLSKKWFVIDRKTGLALCDPAPNKKQTIESLDYAEALRNLFARLNPSTYNLYVNTYKDAKAKAKAERKGATTRKGWETFEAPEDGDLPF